MLKINICCGVLIFSLLSSVSFAGWRKMLWDPDQNEDYSDVNNWTLQEGDQTKVGIPDVDDTIVFSGNQNSDCLIEKAQFARDIQIDANYTKDIRMEVTATTIGTLRIGDIHNAHTSQLKGGNILLEEDTIFEIYGPTGTVLELDGTQILEENEVGEFDHGTFLVSDYAKVKVLDPSYNELDAEVHLEHYSVMEISGGQLDMNDKNLVIDDFAKLTLNSGDATVGPFPEAIIANAIQLNVNGNNPKFEIKSDNHVTIDAQIWGDLGIITLDLDDHEHSVYFPYGIILFGGDMEIKSGDISIGEEELFDVAGNSIVKITSEDKQWIIGDVNMQSTRASGDLPVLLFETPNLARGDLVIDGHLHLEYAQLEMHESFFGGETSGNDHLQVTGDLTIGTDGAIFDYDYTGTRESTFDAIFVTSEGLLEHFTEIDGLQNNEVGYGTSGMYKYFFVKATEP